jgi:hypothetical protein
MAVRLGAALAVLALCASLWALDEARAGVRARDRAAAAGAEREVAARAERAAARSTIAGALPAPVARPPRVASSLKPCVVTGVVRERTGHPAPHATVSLIDAGETHDTRSDEDGSFRLEAPPGDYLLSAVRDDEAAPFVSPLALRPGEELNGIELMLDAGRTLSGIVLGTAGESAYLCVSLAGLEDRCVLRGSSDADGAFTLGPLPAGVVHLEAQIGSRSAGRDASAGTSGLVLRLPPPPPPRERRRASDDHEPTREVRLSLVATDGSPISTSSLSIFYRNGDVHGFSGMGSSGQLTSFTFHLPEGTSEVCAQPSGYLSSCVPLARGATELIFALDRAAEVKGLVRGTDGRPMAELEVTCGADHSWTGTDGRFGLSCPPGRTSIEVSGEHAAARRIPVELAAEDVNYLELSL